MKNIALIISTLLIITSCSNKEANTTDTVNTPTTEQNVITLTEAQMKNTTIQTNQLSSQQVSSTLMLNGVIDIPPKDQAIISSPSGGYIKTANIMQGDFVNKGQTLITLEDANYVQLQQDYLTALSNYEYAQKDYQRQKELNQSQATSDQNMQIAQTTAKNQQIQINALAEKLRILGINPRNISPKNIQKTIALKAPISGYITRINAHIGQYISPTDQLFEIINTQNAQIQLKAFEKDLPYLKKGQKVYAYINQDPDKKYTAEIIQIAQNFNTDKSLSVFCRFIDPSTNLTAGTFVSATVEIEAQQKQALPEDAVVTWEGKQYIFEEIAPNTFKMLPISIGNSENGYIEIISDSEQFAQKKIVTKGAYHLLMGLKNVEE